MHLFETIFSSALTQAFGWTLFHSLWQGFIWVLALSLALRFVSRQKAQLRYVVSLLCLFGLFFSSFATFLYEYQLVSSNTFSLSLTDEAMIVVHPISIEEAISPGFMDAMSTSLENWGAYLPYFSMIWVLGVLFFSLKWMGSWMYLKDIRKNSTEAKYTWQSWVDELAYEMNIRRYVSLRESSQIQSPMVIGHLKPIILLPVGMLTGLSTVQLEAVLAHELAHIRRYDFLVNLLQSVMEILFFYHPAQWWISNQVRDEREHCCDDSAVKVCGNPMAYAKALAALEEMRIQQVQLAPALSGRKPHLLNRIKRLLTPELVEKPRETRVYFLSLVIVALCAMFMVNPGYTQDKVESLVEGIVAELVEEAEAPTPEVVVAAPELSIQAVPLPGTTLNPRRLGAPEPPMLAQIDRLKDIDSMLSLTLTAVSDTPPPPPPPVPVVPPVPPVPDMSGMPSPPTPPMPPTPMIGSFDRNDSVAMEKFELQMEKFGKEMEVWGEKYGKQMEEYEKKIEVWSESMEKDWAKWEKEYEMDFGKWEEKYGKEWQKWGEEYGKKWKKWVEENEGKFEELDKEEREKLKKEIKKLKEQEHRLHEQEQRQENIEQGQRLREEVKQLREREHRLHEKERRHMREEQEDRMREVQTQLREVREAARHEAEEARQFSAEQERELARELQEVERQAELDIREAKREIERAALEIKRAEREQKRILEVRSRLVDKLQEDGVISSTKDRISIRIDGKGMKVNGKKLTDDQYEKYTDFLRETGLDIRKGGNKIYEYTINDN